VVDPSDDRETLTTMLFCSTLVDALCVAHVLAETIPTDPEELARRQLREVNRAVMESMGQSIDDPAGPEGVRRFYKAALRKCLEVVEG
jgi:hypothetical protein